MSDRDVSVENVTIFRYVIVSNILLLADIAKDVRIIVVDKKPLKDWCSKKDNKFYGNKLTIDIEVNSEFVSKNGPGDYELHIPKSDYNAKKKRYVEKIHKYRLLCNIYDNTMFDFAKI